MRSDLENQPPVQHRIPFILLLTTAALTGCGDAEQIKDQSAKAVSQPALVAQSASATIDGVDLSRFKEGSLKSSDIVECELADGSTGKCYELVTTGVSKTGDAIGPFCPRSTSASTSDAGVWLDGNNLYQADGDFIKNLPAIYGAEYPPADQWVMYDESGKINVTDTLAACEAAARPDVDPAYYGYCVECALEDLQQDLSLTFLIPATPQPAQTSSRVGRSTGVSLNGFQIAAMAPVENILAAYTIAAFDDCGGHVNPNDGYHYHAATGADGCNSGGTESDGHPGLMGYAMDGYGLYASMTEDTASLDECNGHEDSTRGYHYHAASPESNSHLPCLSGKLVKTADEGRRGPPGGGPRPDGPRREKPAG